MPVQSLGHVVLKVRDLAVSVPFYRDVLGLREVARYRQNMVFFSLGKNHHDVAMRDHLAQHAVPLLGQSDHQVSQSLYIRDPDGIEIEFMWMPIPACGAIIRKRWRPYAP